MKAKYILAAGVALASGAALAQSDSRRNEQQKGTELPSATVSVDFGSLDSNMDKTLSMDEVSSNSALSQAFSRLDTDGSGGLSNAEFAKFESDGKSAKGATKSKSKSAGDRVEDEAERAGDKLD